MLYRLQEIDTGTELKFKECFFNLKQYHASDMVNVESSTSKSTASKDDMTLDLKDVKDMNTVLLASTTLSLRRVHFDGSTEILTDHLDSLYMCDIDAHYEAPLRMTRSIKNFIINFIIDDVSANDEGPHKGWYKPVMSDLRTSVEGNGHVHPQAIVDKGKFTS
ncbi:hypothetical protein FOL47_001136, partial [Perkinsus chesapeaki]